MACPLTLIKKIPYNKARKIIDISRIINTTILKIIFNILLCPKRYITLLFYFSLC
jgi:hypothetical protein